MMRTTRKLDGQCGQVMAGELGILVLLALCALLAGCGAPAIVEHGSITTLMPTATRALPSPTVASTATTVGATPTSAPAWIVYTDPTIGFSVQMPGGWRFDTTDAGGHLDQWEAYDPGPNYLVIDVEVWTSPDSATVQAFCAARPNTTVAGAPALIADRAIDPPYAVNTQSSLERDFVIRGTYYTIMLTSNLKLPVAQQQLAGFFGQVLTSFSAANAVSGSMTC
jgi:hypothetical protein